jgi:carbonic anhydrase
MPDGGNTVCQFCSDETHVAGQAIDTGTALPRRLFLKASAAAALGLAASRQVFAAPPKAPPKPQNVLSPDAALDRLMKGNTRYVDGVSKRHDFKHEREALAGGQNPFAGILSCADSRIAPEYAFDTARGDLFVCRVAGNFANDDVIASFEYGVSVLNTPLLMVLGHEACGALDAAVKSIRDNSTLPGHLPSLVDALAPAVKAVLGGSGNVVDLAIRKNVSLTVEKLKAATPILSQAVETGKVRVVGAVYRLSTGKIEMLT